MWGGDACKIKRLKVSGATSLWGCSVNSEGSTEAHNGSSELGVVDSGKGSPWQSTTAVTRSTRAPFAVSLLALFFRMGSFVHDGEIPLRSRRTSCDIGVWCAWDAALVFWKKTNHHRNWLQKKTLNSWVRRHAGRFVKEDNVTMFSCLGKGLAVLHPHNKASVVVFGSSSEGLTSTSVWSTNIPQRMS